MRQMMQVFLAALAGAFVAVMMLATAIVQEIRISSTGINGGLFLVALFLSGFLALVCVCETFSRNVEAWLASWRAAKRSAAVAWRETNREEARRLEIEG
jgi:hypothetical protein